jgi:predicted DNA-binding protein
MKRTSFFLPEPMIARLKRLSTKTDVSVAEIIRQATEKHLKRQEAEEYKRTIDGRAAMRAR